MNIKNYLIIFTFIAVICSGSDLKHPIKGIIIPESSSINIPDESKLNVIYIPQNDRKSCATTSVAMAVSYFKNGNNPLDKESIWKISKTDEETVYKSGNDMSGLKRITDHFDLKSEYADNMKITDIEFLISKGILVVLNIKAGNRGTATHAILVTGYNKKKRILYINDPSVSCNKEFKYSDLEKRWSAFLSSPRGMSLRSGFIIYPKQ